MADEIEEVRLAPWEVRPVEVANLLNPAFCGMIILRCIGRYREDTQQGMPYALAFLVVPIILHAETRGSISTRQRMPMYNWLQVHPEAKVGFAQRARSFVPICKEALAFLLQVGAASLDERGLLTVDHARGQGRINSTVTEEVRDFFDKASFAGHWFAQAGTVNTIFAQWGVKP